MKKIEEKSLSALLASVEQFSSPPSLLVLRRSRKSRETRKTVSPDSGICGRVLLLKSWSVEDKFKSLLPVVSDSNYG